MYSVAAGVRAYKVSLVVVNAAATPCSIKIAHIDAAVIGSWSEEDDLVNEPLDAYESKFYDLGIQMQPSSIIGVYSSNAATTFHLFSKEYTD